MKKVLFFTAAVMFSLSIVIISCNKDDNPINCTQLALDYSNAASAYTADQSDANCNTLKNAIEDYLDSDCAALTTAYRVTLQTELEALPCY